MQANGKEPAAAAATAAPSTEAAPEQPSTSSFVSGSVLRLDFDGEGALPDFNAIKEAFGGREAGVRFVEVAEEVGALSGNGKEACWDCSRMRALT